MPVRLIAAPHTPFDEYGDLAEEVVTQQADFLRRQGVRGVFIGGSTGEYASLSVDERCRLAEAWAPAAQRRSLQLFVHVGHNCQRDAILLAEHAARCGADAIASLAPSYFRPTQVEALVEYLAPIAAAGQRPFYYYDIPAMTGVTIPPLELLKRAPEIPHLAGIKFTNPDLAQYCECLQFAADRFDILFGCDEMLLAAYSLGARGAVGSTYNFAASIALSMIDACDASDVTAARLRQARLIRLIRVLQTRGYLASAKRLMTLRGVDCGRVRPPLTNLSPRELELLDAELAEFDELT